jgi:hypothetical protein
MGRASNRSKLLRSKAVGGERWKKKFGLPKLMNAPYKF